jgi:DNA-binding SARP family transcriptional activator
MYHTFRGAYDEGFGAARKILELSRETGMQMFDKNICVFMAGLCIDRMDLESAEAWLYRMPPAAGQSNGVKSLYHAQLLRIAFIRKEYSRALQEGEKALACAEKSGIPATPTQLLQAQLLQVTGNREKASMLLEKARSDALAGNSGSNMGLVLRTEAQFAFDAGDNDRGLSLLEKSLALGRKTGALLPYHGNPATNIGLYARALEAGIEVEYVQELIRRIGFIPEKPPFHIENWPWPLKIYTLGRFTIVKDGTAIRFSGKAQRMPLRLLKVLISLGGREIAEGIISEQLWPDADGDLAHQSFETNLHRLRKMLGHAEALRFSDGKLTLDDRYCWVDIWAFERLLARADEHETQGDTGMAWDVAEKALALYRQNFMTGDSDEVWTISPSERLKAKYFDRLMWLGRSLETAGHIESAVGLYERGLGIDDCMEEIYQRLMICYRHLGKRTKALAVYDRCQKALDATLGIEPSKETEAIHSEFLSQRGRLRVVRTNDRHRA